MPRHRIAFHFVDEAPADRALWEEWLASAPPPVREVSELGERRPLVSVAAPFEARNSIETRRDDELTGLAIARQLVEALVALSASTSRAIRVLISGRTIGSLTGGGADAGITDTLAEWQTMLDARPPDVAEWERAGYLSIWAGIVAREDYEKLLEKLHYADAPVSRFARAIGADYDPTRLERTYTADPIRAGDAINKLSFAPSFLHLIPAEVLDRPVNAVVILHGADFSQRPRDAGRGKLRFCGSYPYDPKSRARLV